MLLSVQVAGAAGMLADAGDRFGAAQPDLAAHLHLLAEREAACS